MFLSYSRSYILVVAALVLIAVPVFGQETQPATGAVEPAKSPESISKSSDASLTESSDVKTTAKDQRDRKPSTVPSDKPIAEKVTLWPKEAKAASVDNPVEAGQDAQPAHDDPAELAKKLSN